MCPVGQLSKNLHMLLIIFFCCSLEIRDFQELLLDLNLEAVPGQELFLVSFWWVFLEVRHPPLCHTGVNSDCGATCFESLKRAFWCRHDARQKLVLIYGRCVIASRSVPRPKRGTAWVKLTHFCNDFDGFWYDKKFLWYKNIIITKLHTFCKTINGIALEIQSWPCASMFSRRFPPLCLRREDSTANSFNL